MLFDWSSLLREKWIWEVQELLLKYSRLWATVFFLTMFRAIESILMKSMFQWNVSARTVHALAWLRQPIIEWEYLNTSPVKRTRYNRVEKRCNRTSFESDWCSSEVCANRFKLKIHRRAALNILIHNISTRKTKLSSLYFFYNWKECLVFSSYMGVVMEGLSQKTPMSWKCVYMGC